MSWWWSQKHRWWTEQTEIMKQIWKGSCRVKVTVPQTQWSKRTSSIQFLDILSHKKRQGWLKLCILECHPQCWYGIQCGPLQKVVWKAVVAAYILWADKRVINYPDFHGTNSLSFSKAISPLLQLCICLIDWYGVYQPS